MPQCRECKDSFKVLERHRAFYSKVSPTISGSRFEVPPPTICPLCRYRRRIAWRGELHLFRRESALSGQPILTFYPPESECRVVSNDEFWGDGWDPLSFGRDFDFNRPFFPQFAELLREVPLLARSVMHNENSDYVNCASWVRNSYLLAGANYDEDCYFGNYVNRCKNSVDNSFVDGCELCYECVDCTGCYDLRYSQNCHNCAESAFLRNCRACRSCFGCVNLVSKEYHFFNEPLTKAEYETRVASMRLDSRSAVSALAAKFDEHRLRFPHRSMLGEFNENVSGNAIHQSRNSHWCFDVSELEECEFCSWFHRAKTSMDCFAWGFPAELCYECMEAGDNSYRMLFSAASYGSRDCLYCYYPMRSRDCFGCISVKQKQYCVLNKQYSQKEYEQLVGRIIRHMETTGEWGEFFPISMSPLCYNTAITGDYFPLDGKSVRAKGWKWHAAAEEPRPNAAPIPDSIDDVEESICQQTLVCAATGKPFRIIRPEFQFYKRQRIPIPDLSFWERHRRRLAKRTPRQLWPRECANCRKAIESSYPPSAKEIVYCEECFRGALV